VTDYKDNLQEMFEPEREVVTYRDAAECADKILFYLDERNSTARERIAAAGHKRTLQEHTYQARMRHLVELIDAV
jgi:spore maturation protein CgeB